MNDIELNNLVMEYGYSLESKNPLILVNNEEKLIGVAAEITLNLMLDEDEEKKKEILIENINSINDNSFLLIESTVDWADEFDLNSWVIAKGNEFKKTVNFLKNYDDEISWCFGSNEEMSFSNGSEILDCLNISVITEQEYKTLEKIFNGYFDGGDGMFDKISLLELESYDPDYNNEIDFNGIILLKFEIDGIEKLKKLGWVITVHNKKEGLLSFKYGENEESISYSDLITDLVEYYKTQN